MYLICGAIFMNFLIAIQVLAVTGLVACMWSISLSIGAIALVGAGQLIGKRLCEIGYAMGAAAYIVLILKILQIY